MSAAKAGRGAAKKADAVALMLAMAEKVQAAANHIAYYDAQVARAMRAEMKRMEEARVAAEADRARVERMNLAATALNGILASQIDFQKNTAALLARAAVELADALIAELASGRIP